jgi:3-dehydroquinate dehydratase-1
VADCARRARRQVDPDDPSIDGIQTLLLLSLALYANGHGKKAYMSLCKSCFSRTEIISLWP